jgi:hypothetical protein
MSYWIILLELPPAYRSKIRNGIAFRPSQRAFNNAYNLLQLPSLTSKTHEIAFQILNCTIWTNNQAFKSRMQPDPRCRRCGKVETMKHLLCECKYYSEPLWNKLAEILTRLFNKIFADREPRVELGQTNVIYNITHPSILLYICDDHTKHTPTPKTGGDEGPHLQKNESTSFCTASK